MSRPLVVVTGKNGQLGWELMQLASSASQYFEFVFAGREAIDLSDPSTIDTFFSKYHPAYLINCAAYTAVDKAETEQAEAFQVNAAAVGQIAGHCAAIGSTLVQVSTDYVFNGRGTLPYLPETPTDPVNYYGYSKWMGEQLALANNPATIVIRTSWVYSRHGHNFVKTMIRLMKEREEIKVVNDQVGSPTYAADLAEAILSVLLSLREGRKQYGIYHFSNEGAISWFDFASAIREYKNYACKLLPQPSSAYPTPAKRPFYSVLNKEAITRDFGIQPRNWLVALEDCLQYLD